MAVPRPPIINRRRTGSDLESALLAAAWNELVEVGYGRLTMGSVAARAQTSEPVLYRRWPNKDRLVVAALDHQRSTHPVDSPDTGSLRSDLIAQLDALGSALAGFYVIAVSASFAGLLADSGLTPSQVRDQALDSGRLSATRALFQRAHDRGELDLDRTPSTVLEMPFDLLRHDLLMGLEAPSPERIVAIVDDLFMPLVRR